MAHHPSNGAHGRHGRPSYDELSKLMHGVIDFLARTFVLEIV